MFEVYSNSDGRSLFICNSHLGLKQCIDYCESERNGLKVSYTTIDEKLNPIGNFSNVKRWIEQ